MGITGSGKSIFLTDTIIPQLQYYIVYDIEQKDEFKGDVVVSSINDLIKGINAKQKIIYQTKCIGIKAIMHEFDEICKVIYLGNLTSYAMIIDEVSDVSTAWEIGDYHFMLMRKGRKRGLLHICCTQRPLTMINRNIFTQSQCKIYFKCDPYDIAKCKGICPHIDKSYDFKKEVYLLKDFEYVITDGQNYKIKQSVMRNV
jgi:hypothetical protein